MKTKTKLTIKRLMNDDPWAIASDLGLGFTGDMNPYDYGGVYYNTRDWNEFGSVDAVLIESHCYDDDVHAYHTTIIRDDNIAWLCRCSGWRWDPEHKTIHSGCGSNPRPLNDKEHIELCIGVNGTYQDDGDLIYKQNHDRSPYTFWRNVRGAILGLTQEG